MEGETISGSNGSDPAYISFVTWPDGRVDGRSLTVCGKRDAKKLFVSGFLPTDWFGNFAADYTVDTLWRGAQDKGFKCHTVIVKDGKPVLEDA
jgi:hypothetical protein